MNSRLLRFLLVFGGGVGIVWALGIGPGGSWFGGKRPVKGTTQPGPTDRRPPPATVPRPDSGIEVRDLSIPVREELEERPGVFVMQYWLHLGESIGGIEKRMRARDVRIDIHNKKPEPDDKVIARVNGTEALIQFATAPDPRAGFQDSQIDGLTLTGTVLVEYLDEDTGETLTTLRCSRLDLSDSLFRAPGDAVIEQEGLVFSGTGLTYDKTTGIFRFERDVTARVTRFSLPGAEDAVNRAADSPNDSPVAVAPPVEKVIRCSGPFEFVPAEEPVDASGDGRPQGADLAEVVGGGVLTFQDDVVASQGDSVLEDCDRLVLHVDRAQTVAAPDAPPADDAPPGDDDAPPPGEEGDAAAGGELEITRVEAYGAAGRRATLTDPRGKLFGDVLLLEPTDAGQEIVLRGNPEIQDAVSGPAKVEGVEPTRISAGATSEIRVRPIPAEATVVARPEGGDDVPVTVDRRALELRDGAWLDVVSPDPERSVSIEGRSIDVLMRKASTGEAPTGDASATDEHSPGEVGPETPPEAEEASFELEHLLAEGDARVRFARGSAAGQRIEGRPSGDAGDMSTFSLVVSPDPVVQLTIPADPASPEARDQSVRIATTEGHLTYAPATDREPTLVRNDGPTTVRVREGGEDGDLVLSLDASEFVRVRFSEGENATLQELEAIGAVDFSSPRENVSGTGDRLVLLPRGEGLYKVELRGSPATATQVVKGQQEPRVIQARLIVYDPETGALHAEDDVDGVVAPLPSTAKNPDGTTAGGTAGRLVAHVLDLTPEKGDDGVERLNLEASGDVTIRNEEQGILATGDRFSYREGDSDAVLLGTEEQPAEVTRIDLSGPDESTNDPQTAVAIRGPRLLIDQASKQLTCPDDGVVVLTRGDGSGRSTRVVARSAGPIVYGNDQLTLRRSVLVRFDERPGPDDPYEEQRALWSDLVTVFFTPADEAEDPSGAEAGSGDAADGGLGFDYLLAEGRVHLEQREPRRRADEEPRTTIGEGESLEWRTEEGREVMILRGVHPRAWVVGLMANRRLRYEGDVFHLFPGSNEFEVENGAFSLVDGER